MIDPVDAHIGGKIRERRKKLGWSQEKLADQIGVRFQQLRKYETGFNRVSGSRLYRIAGALGCEAGVFFPEREVG